MFPPVDHLTVLLFLNGDVRHRGRRRSPVPMLLTGGEPDHIARPNFLNRAFPAPCQAAASRDNESLAERMRAPRGPRTRLEGDAGALNKCWIGCLKKRIDP